MLTSSLLVSLLVISTIKSAEGNEKLVPDECYTLGSGLSFLRWFANKKLSGLRKVSPGIHSNVRCVQWCSEWSTEYPEFIYAAMSNDDDGICYCGQSGFVKSQHKESAEECFKKSLSRNPFTLFVYKLNVEALAFTTQSESSTSFLGLKISTTDLQHYTATTNLYPTAGGNLTHPNRTYSDAYDGGADESSNLHYYYIGGGAAGGAVLVIILILVTVLIIRLKKKKRETRLQEDRDALKDVRARGVVNNKNYGLVVDQIYAQKHTNTLQRMRPASIENPIYDAVCSDLPVSGASCSQEVYYSTPTMLRRHPTTDTRPNAETDYHYTATIFSSKSSSTASLQPRQLEESVTYVNYTESYLKPVN